MIPRITPLPKWVLTDLQPAFYDTEAVTVLELLSKIYGKIEEIVEDYNKFTDEVDEHMTTQDELINDAVNYMKDNLVETVTALYEEGFEQGYYTSKVSVKYYDDTETIEILDTMIKAEDEEY